MSLTKRWLDELTEHSEIEMPVIQAYGGRDALEDGMLIDIESLRLTFAGAPIDRITAALFWQEQKSYPLANFNPAADAEAINCSLEAYVKVIAS